MTHLNDPQRIEILLFIGMKTWYHTLVFTIPADVESSIYMSHEAFTRNKWLDRPLY